MVAQLQEAPTKKQAVPSPSQLGAETGPSPGQGHGAGAPGHSKEHQQNQPPVWTPAAVTVCFAGQHCEDEQLWLSQAVRAAHGLCPRGLCTHTHSALLFSIEQPQISVWC